MQHGLIKVASAVPLTKVADCTYNIQQIEWFKAGSALNNLKK